VRGSYLRRQSHEARHAIRQSRRWRLRRSLMRNQGLSKETAKALAAGAVPSRKARGAP